jgi:hypothetical protein
VTKPKWACTRRHAAFPCSDVPVFSHEFEYDFSMQLRYNYRLYPRPRHRLALGKAFGCARVVFNDGLRAREEAHAAGLPYLTDAELSVRLTLAKRIPERAWLGEVSAVVLQNALADLNTAYRNFFASINGTRRGRRLASPGSGPARITGRRSGSPPTPASGSWQTGSCGCPRSGMCRCGGPGRCRPCRPRSPSPRTLPGDTSPRS